MNLKFNWLGLHISDFEASLRFYTEALGMNASDVKKDWAYFSTTGITFELFGGGKPPVPDRSSWGQGQAVRPSIQVTDLHAVVAEMRKRGVQFTSGIERTEFSEWIELFAPENLRWTLAQAPAYPASPDLHKPHIGWMELKVNRMDEQRVFYRDVMGFHLEEGKNGQVVLRQEPGEPILFLIPGGQPAAPHQIQKGAFTPPPSHLISFETDDIEQAADWLKSRNIPILIGVTRKSWGGIDLYIADIDGNPIQIVQYVPADHEWTLS